MKPKHKETKEIDYWICPWCENRSGDDTVFHLEDGEEVIKCKVCGGDVRVWFSIEYTACPVDKNGEIID